MRKNSKNAVLNQEEVAPCQCKIRMSGFLQNRNVRFFIYALEMGPQYSRDDFSLVYTWFF